jgi:hypothetical protein
MEDDDVEHSAYDDSNRHLLPALPALPQAPSERMSVPLLGATCSLSASGAPGHLQTQFEPDTSPRHEFIADSEFIRLREERQREVDRLSLELLSNSKHYKKYIAKKCPEEQLKRAEESRLFHQYKPQIDRLFTEMLDEYEDLGTISMLANSELQSIFKECVQKAMQHLEWTEYNQNSANSEYDGDDGEDDILFGHAYKSSSSARSRNKSSAAASTSDPFSFWGATIRKSNGSSDRL